MLNKDDPGHCFKCNSTHKVTEIESTGVFSCQGICRKQYLSGSANAKSVNVVQPIAKEWRIGDFCRAVYSADQEIYEGILGEINKTEAGRTFATVKFVGYGNDDSVWIEDLMPSAGPEARAKQAKEADGPVEVTDFAKDAQQQSGVAEAKCGRLWKVGDVCRAIYPEDGLLYEGTLETVEEDGSGRKYSTVRFVGYGNFAVVWNDELVESHGELARKKQEVDAAAAPVAAVEISKPANHEMDIAQEVNDMVDFAIENIITVKKQSVDMDYKKEVAALEGTKLTLLNIIDDLEDKVESLERSNVMEKRLSDVEAVAMENMKIAAQREEELKKQLQEREKEFQKMKLHLDMINERDAKLTTEFQKLENLFKANMDQSTEEAKKMKLLQTMISVRDVKLAKKEEEIAKLSVNNNDSLGSCSPYGPFIVFPLPVDSSGDGVANTCGNALNGFANVKTCQTWHIHCLPKVLGGRHTCTIQQQKSPEGYGGSERFAPLRRPYKV